MVVTCATLSCQGLQNAVICITVPRRYQIQRLSLRHIQPLICASAAFSERQSVQGKVANCVSQGWGDVYYFCGSNMDFCNCSMQWNYRGWLKAIILWNFVLSASVALQKLIIQAGFKGLLPGQSYCIYCKLVTTPSIRGTPWLGVYMLRQKLLRLVECPYIHWSHKKTFVICTPTAFSSQAWSYLWDEWWQHHPCYNLFPRYCISSHWQANNNFTVRALHHGGRGRSGD